MTQRNSSRRFSWHKFAPLWRPFDYHGAQADLAEHLGVGATSVHRYVTGKADVPESRWDRLARFLGCSVEKFTVPR